MLETTHPLVSSYALHRRKQQGRLSANRLRWPLGALSAVAWLTSAYLAWTALTASSIAGCSSGAVFDCGHVLTSRWSSFLGMPVSIPAVLLHTGVLTLLFVPVGRLSRWRWPLLAFAAFAAGIGGLWFIGLQLFVLQHLCPYCLLVHGCGLAMAALIAWHAPLSRPVLERVALGAVGLVSLFALGQTLIPVAEKFELVEYGQSSPAAVVDSDGRSGAERPEGEPMGGATAPPEQDIFESPIQTGAVQPAPAETDLKQTDSVEFGTLETSAVQVNPQNSMIDPLPIRSPIETTSDRHLVQLTWPSFFSPIGLLTAQVGSATSTTTRAAENRKFATIMNDVKLDVKAWPLVGNPSADVVIVEMLDYTCVHCQNTHAAVAGAMEKFGDRLAVMILPVPMDAACNPTVQVTSGQHREACQLAKLAIAVWHLKPEVFTQFHNWLMEAKPNYGQAYVRAEQTVGRDALRQELESGVPASFIEKNVQLYQRAAAGAIPKILFPNSSAVGELRSADTLVSLIGQQLGQRP